MGFSLEASADPAVVGFDAGWKVEFRKADGKGKPVDDEVITLSRQHYFAEIKIERDVNFRAGTFDLVIEGLSDDDYGKLAKGPYLFAKIFLGWRDLGSGFGAALSSLASMVTGGGDEKHYPTVLEGRLLTFERQPGEFLYRSHFTGIDAASYRFRKVKAKPISGVKPGDPARAYVQALCGQDDVGVPVTFHPDGPGQGIDETITIPDGDTVADALVRIANVAHSAGSDQQIPLFLRNDGLHFGFWTAPVDTTDPHKLDLRTGLIESKPVIDDRDGRRDANPFAKPTYVRFDVTMLGRGDIQVGDKVELEVDIPDPNAPTTSDSPLGGLGDVVKGVAAAFGVSTGPDYSPFRVISVRHELSRMRGFVTTLRVETQPKDESGKGTESANDASHRANDEAQRTAAALAARARQTAREVRTLDIGEVNRQSVAEGDEADRVVNAQRVDVQEGLERDGTANAAVRADRLGTPTQLVNKPYLTPFAFGSAGLVIPHYPGMRVADLHYREDASQALVAGCLWPDGKEPESHVGDWWLSLPTEVDSAESVDDSGDADEPSGEASHDLIDGHGARAIHVLGFRISIGKANMPEVGERPEDPPKGELLIEHEKSNAKIHITSDGDIEISTDGELKLSGNHIELHTATSVEVT